MTDALGQSYPGVMEKKALGACHNPGTAIGADTLSQHLCSSHIGLLYVTAQRDARGHGAEGESRPAHVLLFVAGRM